MAVENTNLVQAIFAFRSDADTGVQMLGGAGVIDASLARSGAGVYTIDLEQPLTRDVSAFPAQGEVDYALAPNIEIGADWAVSAELGAGATPGKFDRITVRTLLAGVADDPPATAPISLVVYRFPSVG